MKAKWSMAAAALAVVATAVLAEADLKPWKGEGTPKLAGRDVLGKPFDLEGHRGKVVVVNFWATWCEPCREEMPDLVRFYRDHRGQGLRLVLISADDDDQRAEVTRLLGALGFDGPAFIKRGNDMTFIDALDPKWKGALPATFLFDGRGAKKQAWLGSVTYDDLRARVSGLLNRRKR